MTTRLPPTTSAASATTTWLLPLLLGLAAIAGCRDTVAPVSSVAVADDLAFLAKSGGTLPVHIQQRFAPETEHPDYAPMPCGSGTSLPNRFRAEGVLTPHMGQTQSVLIGVSCALGADSIRIAGVARHAGATGDTLYSLWGGFVTNQQGGTGTLTLHMVLLRGTGRFQHLVGLVEATGEIDLTTRAGWYRGTGTLRERPPLAAGAVPLLPETINSGQYHSCGLSASGAAYCWGRNDFGQLGDGTTTWRSTPTPVAGGLTFRQISAARGDLDGGHTCGITTSGATYCWGGNRKGQLGDGTTAGHLTPTPVAGGLTFTQVSAGDLHTCGLTTSGTVYCWGWNYEGQLGNGEAGYLENADRPSPTAVLGGIVFKQISASQRHTCGITPAGVAFCWGAGSYGQLGYGDFASRYTPYPVAGGLLFKEISAGKRHTCGVSTSGTGYCWGGNSDGQVGDGTQTAAEDRHGVRTPSAVFGGLSFARISAGTLHSCGVTTSGAGYCWGENMFGQVGNGTTSGGVLTPALVPGELGFQQISAGGGQTCAVGISGVGYCWGSNYSGQLGDGTNANRLAPVVVAPLDLTFDRLSGGGYHTCALTPADAAYCWGANYDGQLGDGTAIQRYNPAAVAGGIAFSRISSGYNHSCGLTVSGVAYCWGDNFHGQLGDGTTTSRSAPTPVSGGLVFFRVQAGVEHTCGITDTGLAYCWGGNGQGQLGDGTTTPRHTPTAVSGGHLFAELAVGSYHSCALAKGGAAHCWGSDGAIGYQVPAPVPGDLVFTQLSAGNRFTCGLSGGAAYCWGSNPDGQLGDGTTVNHPYPAPVSGGLAFTQLTTGESHACALTPTGGTYCWGWNDYGQLGDGGTIPRSTPAAVAGGLAFSRISAGLHHSCGVSAGTAYCWGRGDFGQTSGGTRLLPTIISAISFKL